MNIETVEKLIGFEFQNKNLLKQALTHKSWASENKQENEQNEKLEFMGDAVLDLAIGELLFVKYPTDNEGQLSKKRASLVNESHLAQMALQLGLPQYLLLGKGESLTGGASKPRILASAFEALVGALYLDLGWEKAKKFIENQFAHSIEMSKEGPAFEKDYKTRLQEKLQNVHRSTPTYEVVSEEGAAHNKSFVIQIKWKDQVLGEGFGKSKKSAEQDAARQALEKIDQGGLGEFL